MDVFTLFADPDAKENGKYNLKKIKIKNVQNYRTKNKNKNITQGSNKKTKAQ